MSVSNDPVLSGASLSLQDVLKPLEDADCRAILRETSDPMTANELIAVCDIPRSTVYRKLDLLSRSSLVRERNTINPEGGRVTQYERNFADVTISVGKDDDFSVTVE